MNSDFNPSLSMKRCDFLVFILSSFAMATCTSGGGQRQAQVLVHAHAARRLRPRRLPGRRALSHQPQARRGHPRRGGEQPGLREGAGPIPEGEWEGELRVCRKGIKCTGLGDWLNCSGSFFIFNVVFIERRHGSWQGGRPHAHQHHTGAARSPGQRAGDQLA